MLWTKKKSNEENAQLASKRDDTDWKLNKPANTVNSNSAYILHN